MPKKGQSDAYWVDIMKRYARREYQFSTGKKPGHKKWKMVLGTIDACPKNKGQRTDVFGRHVICKCGYHKVC